LSNQPLILVGNTGILVSIGQIAREWNISVRAFRYFCKSTAIPFLITDDQEFISVPALETVLFNLMMPHGHGFCFQTREVPPGFTKQLSDLDNREASERFALYSLAYAGGSQQKIRAKILQLARRLRSPSEVHRKLMKLSRKPVRVWRSPLHLRKKRKKAE